MRCSTCDDKRVYWIQGEFPIPCPDCNENSPEFRRKKHGQQQRPEGHRGEAEGEGQSRPQPRTKTADRHQSSALSNDCDQDEGA